MTAAEREQALRDVIAREPVSWLDRVIVLESCGSTQDEAFNASAGRPGLLLSAVHQTSARGRLGRSWQQGGDLGLALTIVLDANKHDARDLPIRIGCAVCHSCEHVLAMSHPRLAKRTCWVKWPNDVVAWWPPGSRSGGGYRKLAGILIERRDNLLLVGIGINLEQGPGDWPREIEGTAISLVELETRIPSAQAPYPRHHVAITFLIEALENLLFAHRLEIEEEFGARNCLLGTRQEFEHDGRRFAGIVRTIRPVQEIELQLDDGTMKSLPAQTTVLVRPG